MSHKSSEYYKRCALNGISATGPIRDNPSNSSPTKFGRQTDLDFSVCIEQEQQKFKYPTACID
jgi:hypothetical protein